MNPEQTYLALLLDAPLQSWGYQSRFDRRTSLSHPTRSGVIGLICAAMGIDRADSARLAEFAELELTVYTLRQEGRMVDFHTVGGGWDKKVNPQNLVRKASGGPGNTVVTRREYLEGAMFGVILTGPASQFAEIAEALRNPQWGVWLGRKSCIPASPVCQGLHDSHEKALKRLLEVADVDRPLRTVEEVDTFEEGTDSLMDTPLDFATREFAPRRIAVD